MYMYIVVYSEKYLNIIFYLILECNIYSFIIVGYKVGCFFECFFEIMVKFVIWFFF